MGWGLVIEMFCLCTARVSAPSSARPKSLPTPGRLLKALPIPEIGPSPQNPGQSWLMAWLAGGTLGLEKSLEIRYFCAFFFSTVAESFFSANAILQDRVQSRPVLHPGFFSTDLALGDSAINFTIYHFPSFVSHYLPMAIYLSWNH